MRKIVVLAVALLPSWTLATAQEAANRRVAVVQAEASVRAEKWAVLTVAPIHGAGLTTKSAIPATKAYEVLGGEARKLRPNVRLYALATNMHVLADEGASCGWTAEFLTDTPARW